MDKRTKETLKQLGKETEIKLARSILRWKYKKEGKAFPSDFKLEKESHRVADLAHQVIAKRGKDTWEELKKAYLEGSRKKGGSRK